MGNTQFLLGVNNPGDVLVVRDLKRVTAVKETVSRLLDEDMKSGLAARDTNQVLLNAWTGSTREGHPVHLSYHIRELTVEVDLPVSGGGRSSLTVLRWKPHLALNRLANIGLFDTKAWYFAGHRSDCRWQPF